MTQSPSDVLVQLSLTPHNDIIGFHTPSVEASGTQPTFCLSPSRHPRSLSWGGQLVMHRSRISKTTWCCICS